VASLKDSSAIMVRAMDEVSRLFFPSLSALRPEENESLTFSFHAFFSHSESRSSTTRHGSSFLPLPPVSALSSLISSLLFFSRRVVLERDEYDEQLVVPRRDPSTHSDNPPFRTPHPRWNQRRWMDAANEGRRSGYLQSDVQECGGREGFGCCDGECREGGGCYDEGGSEEDDFDGGGEGS